MPLLEQSVKKNVETKLEHNQVATAGLSNKTSSPSVF